MLVVLLRIRFQHLCVYYHLIAFKLSYNPMAESVEGIIGQVQVFRGWVVMVEMCVSKYSIV